MLVAVSWYSVHAVIVVGGERRPAGVERRSCHIAGTVEKIRQRTAAKRRLRRALRGRIRRVLNGSAGTEQHRVVALRGAAESQAGRNTARCDGAGDAAGIDGVHEVS